jgi:tetratricopeptide (TPR) repeat protein/predicted Ser/Thr protein kinase
MEIFRWYWDQFLGAFVRMLAQWFNSGELFGPWVVTGLKIALTILLLLAIYEIYLFFMRWNRRRKLRKEDFLEGTKATVYGKDDSAHMQTLNATKDLEGTIEPLKREKRYDRVAEVYASLNQPKLAAKWYRKAGDKPKAAIELAKAGYTVKAARMLERTGDFATAARFYEDKGRHKDAARAHEKAGNLAASAASFAAAGKVAEACQGFRKIFEQRQGDPAGRLRAADACYALLQDAKATAKLDGKLRQVLLHGVACQFEEAQRLDMAAELFRKAGDPARAGDIYRRLGRLNEAVQCLRAAGREREATLVTAQHFEDQRQWKEAAEAYAHAQEWRKAGDNFSKAMDAVRAADCYARAKEFFGAGFALIHGKKWESAIPHFQQVPEDHANYAESRALLGRCFYELHDYERCTATLENYLTGERVRTSNIDYFWMLALAYEQLGDLEKSRGILLKIQTVNVGFRDVRSRLSNIDSRISMMASPSKANMASDPGAETNMSQRRPDESTQIMSVVDNAVGTRYHMEKELGRGGMGVVYLARDTQLDRPIALKFLGTLLDDSDEFRQRFVREARTAAKVNHPNIVSIYDVSDTAGKAYIAMEYVDGVNMARYLSKKGRLEPREAISHITQVLSALQAVHEVGIVHRDIKPENIVLAKGGLVKLMDFGLAKGGGQRLTAADTVMGTPSYMAPEQCRGQDVDHRADLYAVGLVLHEMLTGKIVFGDGDILLRQISEVPEPPGKLIEGLPVLLDQVVMKSIAKKADERFASAREFAGYLRQVKDQL